DVSYAQNLANKINIYCYILTEPQSHLTKAYHVQTTWARRCTRFGFISSKAEKLMKMLGKSQKRSFFNHCLENFIHLYEGKKMCHVHRYKKFIFQVLEFMCNSISFYTVIYVKQEIYIKM
ncbi:unnamed protein product, partial [Schistosoma mattheei]